jgi:predicted nucleic acid-binding protein
MKAGELLVSIRNLYPLEEFALSVITLGELSFGLTKADSIHRRARRRGFIEEIQKAFEVVQLTAVAAIEAGTLRAELQQVGLTTDLADLLIASTALELDYAVGTANVRHFRRVPGLRVVEL